jgi:hypothetical protein
VDSQHLLLPYVSHLCVKRVHSGSFSLYCLNYGLSFVSCVSIETAYVDPLALSAVLRQMRMLRTAAVTGEPARCTLIHLADMQLDDFSSSWQQCRLWAAYEGIMEASDHLAAANSR